MFWCNKAVCVILQLMGNRRTCLIHVSFTIRQDKRSYLPDRTVYIKYVIDMTFLIFGKNMISHMTCI